MQFRLPPGRKERHRKQVILFGIAVLLPALLLLIYTLHLGRQDRELRQRRAQEVQSVTAQAIGRLLADHLNQTSLNLLRTLSDVPSLTLRRAFDQPDILFVSRLEGDRLWLPWELIPRGSLDTAGEYSVLVAKGRREEFQRARPLRAAQLYRRAHGVAVGNRQKHHAKLLEIRALSKAGHDEETLDLSRSMLALPADQRDEYGIPYCMFAAERLSSKPEEIPAVLERLETLTAENLWLPPPAYFLALDVLVGSESAASGSDIVPFWARLKDWTERSLELQRKLTGLTGWAAGVAARDFSPSGPGRALSWEAFGEMPWIIGLIGSDPGAVPYVMAFEGPEALAASLGSAGDLSFPGECVLAGDGKADAIRLDSPFSGLSLVFSEESPEAWAGSSLPTPVFYWLALILVMSVTVFGMYLLLRDVRREMRLADLRSQFVSSVSHELKTPLTAIRMFSESLRIGKTKKPEVQAEYLDTIVGESERLSRLLNNVLDFTKIEQGTRSYLRDPLSLEKVLDDSVKAIAFPLKQQGFVLSREIDPGLPDIIGDRDALEQAVLNLLHNAIKFSGDNRKITLRLFRKENEAVIQVSDMGIGIKPENRQRIFEKYFRESYQRERKIPGTGLGLTIVGHIVYGHNGRIEVESEPKRGSTFSIYLRLEEE